MNMVVPIGLLTPIMKDLLSYGRVNRPARPWLGMYATEADDAIVVGGLADNGPAEQAGVRMGDRILAVGGDDISDLAGLWRRVWAAGSAGAEVRLRLMRDKTPVALTVRSGDRTSFLKSPKLH
jgi:S1-C subfamily serine protease